MAGKPVIYNAGSYARSATGTYIPARNDADQMFKIDFYVHLNAGGGTQFLFSALYPSGGFYSGPDIGDAAVGTLRAVVYYLLPQPYDGISKYDLANITIADDVT